MIMRPARSLIHAAAAALALTFGAGGAAAQTYPERPIQVIVPFAGGSASDVLARVVTEHVGNSIGKRVVVDNRPGAGGNIGTAAAARAEPDGYTLLMNGLPLAVNKTLLSNPGFDWEKDLDPIALYVQLPNVIVVSSKVPIYSLKDLIAFAKTHPKELNYGSVGVGSSQHLAGAYFEQVAGVQMTHVPYRNIAQFVTDMISGQVQLGFQLLPNVLSMINAGQARPLAVTSKTRLAALPNVPTAAEAGVTGFETTAWFVFAAPRGTPKPIIERLNKEIVAAVGAENVRKRFTELGGQAVASTPEETGKFVAAEIAKWREVITKANIKVE